MRIPDDWTTERIPGYGNVYQLTHECGWSTPNVWGIDLLDEQQVRRIVYGHECEDKREAREAAQRRDDQLATLTRTVTALEAALLATARTFAGVAVLDLRDGAVLRTDLALLHHTDRALIARVLGECAHADNERAIIDKVREAASDEDTEDGLGFRDVVGVRFHAHREEDGYFLSRDEGTVLFAEGDTATAEFPGVAPLFAKHCGCVGPDYSLIVDLRGSGTLTTYDNDNETIHHHLGVPNPHATTLALLADIREVIEGCAPDRIPVGVAFRTDRTEYENGYFLDHSGEVLFTDGTTTTLDFDETGERLAQLHGKVGTKAVAWIHLTEGTITRDDDGFDTIHNHFNQPEPQ